MLIVFYLVFQNSVSALPVMNLLLYLLLWYIPCSLLRCRHIKRQPEQMLRNGQRPRQATLR